MDELKYSRNMPDSEQKPKLRTIAEEIRDTMSARGASEIDITRAIDKAKRQDRIKTAIEQRTPARGRDPWLEQHANELGKKG